MEADIKKIKEDLKKKGFSSPEKYYPTKALTALGYQKCSCRKCSRVFYSVENTDICGDPACSGGFRFIGKTPAKNKLDYIEAWNVFARIMGKQGYTAIPRYPCVARWRTDEYWVGASIYDFQPFVVSGEVEPPANPLVVPQFCLRFNDIDNVGITGSHYTGFIMQGQHAFVPAEKYDKDKYLTDLHNWFTKGIGIPKEEMSIHLDSWAGGGNAGISCEFMSRGLEIANQVYMQYGITGSGLKELNLKVLDMGQGQERVAWFSQGTSTSYETTFPSVCKKMFSATGIKTDAGLMSRFLPYSSYLNVDEVEDIEKTWQDVADRISMDKNELRNTILPLSALFSIGEHSRASLVAITDGALPSNVGGGYNLRVILRRALSFIDKHGWDIDLNDICDWHASYLKPLFPELRENLENVKKILDVERRKYIASKEKTSRIVSRLLDNEIKEEKLIELYDSNGISPELVKEEARKNGKDVKIPDNFYIKVAERHEQREQEHATDKYEDMQIEEGLSTKALYFDDYKLTEFDAKIVKIVQHENALWIVLDQTAFYPTSGGQLHDIGEIEGINVSEVIKKGSAILHKIGEKCKLKEGMKVHGKIDIEHRKQLAQHHTATHIVNAAARKILGNHINQASAKKTREKAHLDVTHYDSITEEEVKRIEEEANKIVGSKVKINKFFLPRGEAERKYGMRLYQGGAVPGKEIRIVDIPGIDVEACGGTHLNNTGEAGEIKIVKTSKIQDGIVRITFTAGEAAKKKEEASDGILDEAAKLLEVSMEYVPLRAEELFLKWKNAKKALKKGREIKAEELELKALKKFEGDLIDKTAAVLSTQKEHIAATITRFKKELEEIKKRL